MKKLFVLAVFLLLVLPVVFAQIDTGLAVPVRTEEDVWEISSDVDAEVQIGEEPDIECAFIWGNKPIKEPLIKDLAKPPVEPMWIED